MNHFALVRTLFCNCLQRLDVFDIFKEISLSSGSQKAIFGTNFCSTLLLARKKTHLNLSLKKKKTWMNGSYNSTETDDKPKLYIKEKSGNV